MENIYATVDDVDLLVGALLESLCPNAMVGPTARCILTDSFYRIRYGDRFFHDVKGQPGSFSSGMWTILYITQFIEIFRLTKSLYFYLCTILEQLNALRKIDLAHIFCATTDIKEIPANIFKQISPR